MKLLIFLGASLAYLLFAWIVVLLAMYRCWSGTSEVRKKRAEAQFPYVICGLPVVYIIGSIWFWFLR